MLYSRNCIVKIYLVSIYLFIFSLFIYFFNFYALDESNIPFFINVYFICMTYNGVF